MDKSRPFGPGAKLDVLPHVADLCRNHEIGLELLERSADLDAFLDRVLDEYEGRIAELTPDALDGRTGPKSADAGSRLLALVMFASLAAAIRDRAEVSKALSDRASGLERINADLETALAEAQRARARLDGVVSALDAAILIVDRSGRILKANPVAASLLGRASQDLAGAELPAWLARVAPGERREIRLDRPAGGGSRVLLAARTAVPGEQGDEVLLLSDVTDRYREIERRHEADRLADLLRTVGVLGHKINNPLTALLGRAQLLREKAAADPAVAKAARVIEESATRIADLIRQLGAVIKEGRREDLERVLAMDEPEGESRMEDAAK